MQEKDVEYTVCESIGSNDVSYLNWRERRTCVNLQIYGFIESSILICSHFLQRTFAKFILFASSNKVFSSYLRICVREAHNSTITISGRTFLITCETSSEIKLIY